MLLSGGNPQISKADGDAPVQAYIAAMPGWKRELGKRLDSIIVRTVPNVCKAVKWNSPFYGVKGHGYFLGYHCLTKYVKVAFFRGAELRHEVRKSFHRSCNQLREERNVQRKMQETFFRFSFSAINVDRIAQ